MIKSNNVKQRNYGIDILKTIAVLLVLSVHFFLNTNYYGTEQAGIGMKVQSLIRNFCMICVPLFLVITGFLNKKKEYNKSFFKGLSAILIIWLFYSIIEYFVLNILNGTTGNLNFNNLLLSITSFTACGYSWYIEMYIGLYLISPILNNAFDVFDDKNKKNLTLLILTIIILPGFINTIFKTSIHFPSWWTSIYPIAYYIIGKYLSYTKPTYNKKTLIILLFFNQILMMSFNYLATIEFNSLPTFINTIIVFLLFYNINIKNNKLQTGIAYISIISLDIYLASSLIDKLLYPHFNNILATNHITQQYAILYAPIIIIIVFILSIIYGSIRKKLINIR